MAADVAFIIIGGQAAVAHGSAYVTNDLDLCYERSLGNVRGLVPALARFKPQLRIPGGGLPFLWDEKTVRRGLNFTLMTLGGDVDLLGEVTRIGSYHDVIHHAITIPLFGRRVKIMGLDDLIRAKRAVGRPKDQPVIIELQAIKALQSRHKLK